MLLFFVLSTTVFLWNTQKGVDILIYFKYAERHEIIKMKDNIKYYVVKQKALPEVLLKVAEANRLIENKNISIADATEKVGISRSSYYKYKDDIFPFRDNSKGKTITFVQIGRAHV